MITTQLDPCLRHCDIMSLFMFTVSKKKKKSILKAYFPEILSCLYLFSVKLKLLVPTQVATSIDKYLDSAFLNLLEYI